jgi:quercetin dioxygenase-like cupin family protein
VNSPKHLDLRKIFGVQARIGTPASETRGEYVEMECTAEAGSGTMVHFHPEQEETFRVLEGSLELLRDGRWTVLLPGDTHTVGKGEVHAWRNVATTPVKFVNVHRPAGGFQDHMEMLDRLAKAGKVRGTKDPRSLIYMSMSAVRHRPDVTVKPPQWVVDFMAFLGRRLGYKLD